MSGHAQTLADRRLALVARSDAERRALGATFSDIERRLFLVEVGYQAVRRVHRHRALLGAVTIWSAVAPVAARLWIRRLGWWLPMGIEGLRLARWFVGQGGGAREEG